MQLGAARLDLGPGWLVHAGDDPAYARPDFDDSHWLPFNAATGSLHDLFPHSRPAVVWYRIHAKVRPTEQYLALREYMISSAFVVYTNGAPLTQVGSVAPFVPYEDQARLVEEIPSNQVATGSIVIAVRVHLSSAEWQDVYPGVRDWKLSLGDAPDLRENTWLQVIGEGVVWWLDDCILLCLLLGALLLYSAQRKQLEYLWLVLLGLDGLLPVPLSLYSLFHTFPIYWHIVDVLSGLLFPYLFARMYLAFAEWPLGWRLHVYLLMASLSSAAAGAQYLAGVANNTGSFLLNAPYIALISVILPAILIAQFRRGKRDAGILLVPLLLASLYIYAEYVTFLLSRIPAYRNSAWDAFLFIHRVQIGPLAIDLASVQDILSWISLALIILLRTNRISRQQTILEAEVENARAVQQVILPEHAGTVPGYEVESVYEPAQQVGGDFFQVLPDGAGGLLVVIGDVAGKGLPAAMLVSVLVGAIRTAAAYSQVPAEILAQLNERLMGRTHGGFSTAMAVRIAAVGAVTVANAGHLPPYLDGRELDLPGALPLGVVSVARYETTQFQLAPGSRLTFYSDGVIEAQNERRELFGFDRARAISSRPAAEIAAAAKRFGQSDDITVVAIRRSAAIATAA